MPNLVTLTQRANSPFWYLRYRDPETGIDERRSTKTTDKRKAERAAAKWENEIIAGQKSELIKRTSWVEFRQAFEEEHFGPLRDNTFKKAGTVLDAVENLMGVRFIGDITSQKISKWLADLRNPYEVERGGKVVTITRSESTVNGYRQVLQTAMNWASATGRIASPPKFPKQARVAVKRNNARVMKGRPITDAEFTLLISKAAEVVGEDRAHEWIHLLTGLKLSGLRLDEALEVGWERSFPIRIDTSGKYPMLAIDGEAEKAGEDRLLPITREFANFLEAIPEHDRHGALFKLTKRKNRASVHGERASLDWVSKTIVEIGEKSGIVVNEKTGKTVSAQDLRRTFGQNWKYKVQSPILKELMRHKSIETTNRFYTMDDAQATAEIVWGTDSDLGHTFGHTGEKE